MANVVDVTQLGATVRRWSVVEQDVDRPTQEELEKSALMLEEAKEILTGMARVFHAALHHRPGPTGWDNCEMDLCQQIRDTITRWNRGRLATD